MLNLALKTHKWISMHVDFRRDECLPWPYSRARGYGNLKYENRITYAHVVMCEQVNGSAPSSEHQAAHSCGNTWCVNPKHISWKTPSENQLDKRTHGTTPKEPGKYKLTPEDVARIRSLQGEMTHDNLAEMFGVSRRNIGAILQRRSWPGEGYTPRGFAIPGMRERARRKAYGQSARSDDRT